MEISVSTGFLNMQTLDVTLRIYGVVLLNEMRLEHKASRRTYLFTKKAKKALLRLWCISEILFAFVFSVNLEIFCSCL